MPTISQRAVDKIVGYEVSSRSYYERALQHPEWPGGASGVTVGIGYDLGYASVAKIQADWEAHVDAAMLAVMKRCSGVNGSGAQSLCASVRSQITIPWDAAMEVFLHRDIPQWTTTVCTKVPLADQLPPDSLGALVSLAYNRGASFDAPGDRYREMRDIKTHTAAHQWELDPNDIRSMKRLWPTVAGLRKRRDDEAALFELGLKSSPYTPPPHTINETPPNLPPPPVSSNETGSVVTGGTTTAGAAAQAASAGWPLSRIILIVVVGVVVTAAVAFIAYRVRKSTPVLARQKDAPPIEVQQDVRPARFPNP